MKTRLAAALLGGGLIVAGGYAVTGPSGSRPSGPQRSQPDLALRKLLGVRSLVLSHRPPVGQDHYVLTLFPFTDGQFCNHGPGSSGVLTDADRVLRVEVLWDGPAGKRIGIQTPNIYSSSEGEFWQRLDGELSYSLNPDESLDTYEGYQILGFASSKHKQNGEVSQIGQIGGLSFRESLKDRKYVLAVGVRTFRTGEEAGKEIAR